MEHKEARISLGRRVRYCESFRSVGVLPNWEDYPPEAKTAIRDAAEIFYPSTLYEDVFLSVEKDVFPRSYYRFMGNKILQSNLFQLLGISHPRTHLYYGRRRRERIRREFSYPFVAKVPVGSSKGAGVYLISCEEELDRYLGKCMPAYIQEYLPIDRDLRVVLIAGRVVHAYWRVQRTGEYRNNVAQGASVSYEDIPVNALEFASDVARRCCFDEVGLDICCARERYYVIEANMVFGLEGFRQAGLDIYEIFAELDSAGILRVPRLAP